MQKNTPGTKCQGISRGHISVIIWTAGREDGYNVDRTLQRGSWNIEQIR